MSKQENKPNLPTSVMTGFVELLPAEQLLFNQLKDTIRAVYESFGFVPLDTPTIERSEILLAKAGGETEKQIYRFTKGDNDLSLRFDLTVPLARYVSDHLNDLVFPARFYHIGKVYRGERPQKGRFREFYQCDIDIIGRESLGLANDAELIAVIAEVFKRLNLPKFIVRINNRKLIIGLLEEIGVSAGEQAVEVMRIIDKIEKIPLTETKESLLSLGLKEDVAQKVMDFVSIKGKAVDILRAISQLNIKNENFVKGLSELQEVVAHLSAFGLPEDIYGLDLSIVRGLDYYTGTVYETKLVDYPNLGSICSGGRYENLAQNYTTQKLPGVGISIGLTRLFSQLKEAGLIKVGGATPSRALIIPFDDRMAPRAIEVSRYLRQQGINNEVYFEEGKFKDKLSYANKLGVNKVIIIGEDELEAKSLTVKDMKSGEQQTLELDELTRVFD